jgi:hypothetical protein
MKGNLLSLLGVVLAVSCLSASAAAEEVADKYPANLEPVEAINEFSRLNPSYKQRCGRFYEKAHLVKATEQLAELLKPSSEKTDYIRQILRAFIYDFLTFYMHDGGQISVDHHKTIVAAMDEKFRREFTPVQYEAYMVWRDNSDGSNSMAFLTMPRAEAQK